MRACGLVDFTHTHTHTSLAYLAFHSSAPVHQIHSKQIIIESLISWKQSPHFSFHSSWQVDIVIDLSFSLPHCYTFYFLPFLRSMLYTQTMPFTFSPTKNQLSFILTTKFYFVVLIYDYVRVLHLVCFTLLSLRFTIPLRKKLRLYVLRKLKFALDHQIAYFISSDDHTIQRLRILS